MTQVPATQVRQVVSDTAYKVMHTTQFPSSIEQMIDEIADAVIHLYNPGTQVPGRPGSQQPR